VIVIGYLPDAVGVHDQDANRGGPLGRYWGRHLGRLSTAERGARTDLPGRRVDQWSSGTSWL